MAKQGKGQIFNPYTKTPLPRKPLSFMSAASHLFVHSFFVGRRNYLLGVRVCRRKGKFIFIWGETRIAQSQRWPQYIKNKSIHKMVVALKICLLYFFSINVPKASKEEGALKPRPGVGHKMPVCKGDPGVAPRDHAPSWTAQGGLWGWVGVGT